MGRSLCLLTSYSVEKKGVCQNSYKKGLTTSFQDAGVQSRIRLPARHTGWHGGACTGQQLWVAQGQPQPQGMLAGLHWCPRVAALVPAVVGVSCLETLGLDMEGDMSKMRYTGQNSHG